MKDPGTSIFTDEVLSHRVIREIHHRCTERGAIAELLCLMPDHLHILIQLRDVSLVDLVSDLKSSTTRVWWTHGGTGALWQRRFYDHGIRDERDYNEVVRYIIENPVKAGLVEYWADYPYTSGSLLLT